MKVNSITMSDYQSIGEEPCTISTEGITILTGPNSAGKSSVLDFIKEIGIKGLSFLIPPTDHSRMERGISFEVDSSSKSLGHYFPERMHIEEMKWDEYWEEKYGYDFNPSDFYENISMFYEKVDLNFSGDGFTLHVDEKLVLSVTRPDTRLVTLIAKKLYGRKLETWMNEIIIDCSSHERETLFSLSTMHFNISICRKLGIFIPNLSEITSNSDKKSFAFSDKYPQSILSDSVVNVDGDILSIYGFDADSLTDPNLFELTAQQSQELLFPGFGNIYDKIDKSKDKIGLTVFEDSNFSLTRIFLDPRVSKTLQEKYRLEFLNRSEETKTSHKKLREMGEKAGVITHSTLKVLHRLVKKGVSDNFAHISGDRSIISSTLPAHIEFSDSDDPTLNFLKDVDKAPYGPDIASLAHRIETESRGTNLEINSKDPDNTQLEIFRKNFAKYLPSLSSYEVITKSQEIRGNANKPSQQHVAQALLIYLKVKNVKGMELNFSEVGSGLSYILPIAAGVSAKNLTFVEEPELHLHPAAQCELGDFFIAASNFEKSLIIETHSEHIILRLLRRVRETCAKSGDHSDENLTLFPMYLNIYYFKPDEKGETTVKHIRVSHKGEFLNTWPDGFFSERESELFQ